jgi:hypothetical protein
MAPATGIIALKVFPDNSGNGNFSDIEEALQWVVANVATYNIASINISIGDSGNYNSPTSLYGLGDELAALNAMNVIVVSAVGNSYFQYQGQGVSYPAADPNSLAVGAVWDGNYGKVAWSNGAIDYSTGTDRIPSFSQRSTSTMDIFAPGAWITGANQNGDIVTMAGTSQASPHIAGIATLAQQLAVQKLGRRLTMSEFSRLLNTTGTSIFDGDNEDDNVANTQQSYRRVDVLALGNAILAMGVSGIDLVGTSFEVVPCDLFSASGQAIASLNVRNRGGTAAGAFDIQFYLSDDAYIDPATDLLLTLSPSDPNYNPAEPAAYHLTSLESLAAFTASVGLIVPVCDPFGTDNHYYLGMVVDAGDDVSEAIETNNLNLGQGLDGDDVNYDNSPPNIDAFESGDFSHLPWVNSGDANWLITKNNPHGGFYSAQSGDISDSQAGTLAVTRTTAAGVISFWRKVSSESNYDYLRFYVDGGTALGSWSGEQGWAQFSCTVTAGTLTFTWTYSKDSSVSVGSDAVWIDDIVFPMNTPPFPGDYNRDRVVDSSDYIVWRKTLGSNIDNYSGADGSGNGTVGPEDYDIWRANFGNALPIHAGSEVEFVQDQPQRELAMRIASQVDVNKTAASIGSGFLGQPLEVKRQNTTAIETSLAIESLYGAQDQLIAGTTSEISRPLREKALSQRSTIRAITHRKDEAIVAWLSRTSYRDVTVNDMANVGHDEMVVARDSQVQSIDRAMASLDDYSLARRGARPRTYVWQ